ncbi:MAG: glycosyltransferase family 25 protein [Bdellovibrionales bacterium]
MRIFLINLARAPERRQNMARQFSSAGLAFESAEAIDGRQLTDADRRLVDHERRRRITPYPLSDNEIGCWLSHRRVLQKIADDNIPMAAVVEDDAVLAPDLSGVLAAIEKQAPVFDFIFLHRKMKTGEIFVPTMELVPGLRLGRVGPAHMGAIAYVVSSRGAKRFLAYAPRFVHAVDKEIHRYWANGLEIYGLERPAAGHDDGGHSFIEETRGQESPACRPRYAGADNFYWRLMRFVTRLSDSVRKRRAWSALIGAGKKVS